MNLTNRSSDAYNSASSYLITLNTNSPSENDLMFALLLRQGSSEDPTSSPGGWTPIGLANNINNLDYCCLWYKLASASEPTDYTWQWGSAAHNAGNMSVWYGDYDTADLFDVVSDTVYSTDDTIVRAADMTVTQENAAALWFGAVFSTSDLSLASPSGWSSGISAGNTTSDLWSRVSTKILSSTGATGDVDGSISSSSYNKHAYMVALNGTSSPIGSGQKVACVGL